MATIQQPEQAPLRQARRPILRRTARAALMVLGCLRVALSLIAAYVRVTVLNTDRFVRTMEPVAASPAVQQAVAAKLDAAISGKVDYDALMQDVLPSRVDRSRPRSATRCTTRSATSSTGSSPPTISRRCGTTPRAAPTRASSSFSAPGSPSDWHCRATPCTSTSAPPSTASASGCRTPGSTAWPRRSRRTSTGRSRS